MLTGMFAPTAGDGIIFGHSIHDEMEEIRKIMGVCPQHDVLWDQMTGEEHLQMFAALKGLNGEEIKKEVDERLKVSSCCPAFSSVCRMWSSLMQPS